jgi:methylenetetrahydrofolate reductase (NADPH)
MSNVVVQESLPDLKPRIMEFARRASTEVTTHDEELVPALAETLWPGSTVYVAHTPKATLEDVVRVSVKIESSGLRASPHIVARRVPSERALRDALLELRQAGVEQVLVIAGDRDEPMGPFFNSMDVLGTLVLRESGMRRVGVAGHPEGHKVVEPAVLRQALRQKQDFAERTGIAVHIVTQFGFSAQALCRWRRLLADNGVLLPVHVGIAGPTSLSKLLRFAIQCGVGASMNSLLKNKSMLHNVARPAVSPEGMISALVSEGAGFELPQLIQPHVFTFGGAAKSAQWLRAVSEGQFGVQPDGSVALYS